MTKRLTKQGCTVETTCTIQPNGAFTENITLSVEPGSKLSLAIEERSGRTLGPSNLAKWVDCGKRYRK